ncbi:hypothetical protein Clacol_001580 [Clathrus columnatus]|uniref:BZIP domain-containing protein n=1 Tax=Clathrus columnatus TaxID=1419009 RepID=A0AAV5A3Z2_9AGAM|nr:hypothetical protein Clacol_001580 [Clathrus columnatus]
MEHDSDADYEENNNHTLEEPPLPGQPKRKKKNNSQAARRDQNRIAQREFRLRKQQRIRDLEARVELLSESKDEIYIQMRNVVRELIAENHTLRSLVRNLSNFIGEGSGGVFKPPLGWTRKEFETFINKAETDTAFEVLMKRRKEKAQEEANRLPKGSAARDHQNQAGSSSTDPLSSSSTTTQNRIPRQFDDLHDHLLDYLSAGNTDPSTSSQYVAGGGIQSSSAPSLINGFQETLSNDYPNNTHLDFSPPPPPPPQPPPSFLSTTNSQGNFTSSFSHPTTTSISHFPFTDSDDIVNHVFDSPKIQDACKLISYHLNNFRRNSAYCLPPSLRPTLIQRTVDHESIIDGIPHPEIRNRMILLRGRFNLLDCVHKYLKHTEIHGDDVLVHTNWEIHDAWLKEFGFLIDHTTLATVNRRRKERGEREMAMVEICPEEQAPPGVGMI